MRIIIHTSSKLHSQLRFLAPTTTPPPPPPSSPPLSCRTRKECSGDASDGCALLRLPAEEPSGSASASRHPHPVHLHSAPLTTSIAGVAGARGHSQSRSLSQRTPILLCVPLLSFHRSGGVGRSAASDRSHPHSHLLHLLSIVQQPANAGDVSFCARHSLCSSVHPLVLLTLSQPPPRHCPLSSSSSGCVSSISAPPSAPHPQP